MNGKRSASALIKLCVFVYGEKPGRIIVFCFVFFQMMRFQIFTLFFMFFCITRVTKVCLLNLKIRKKENKSWCERRLKLG